jgi:predicted CXXCH cytochrome family protein
MRLSIKTAARMLSFIVITSFFLFPAVEINASHETTHLKDVRSINNSSEPALPGPSRIEANPHGLFTSNTNTCAKCHSVHRGRSAKILLEQTQEQTCYLCHDGRGSKYDVKNGKYFDEETGIVLDSVSGGFNGFNSSHDIESSHQAPGGNGSQIQVVCTSCHNPHGSANHRNLQTTVNGKTGIEVKASVAISPLSHKEVISYESGISTFCISCHEDYNTYYQENQVNDNRHYRHPIETLLTGGKARIESASVPKPLTFIPTLFTSLPTQGVPSGAYPNPNTSVVNSATLTAVISGGGTFATGDYYYVVTKKMKDGKESVIGYKTLSSVPEASKITLNWQADTTANSYIVYRAKKLATNRFTPITKVMVAPGVTSFIDSGGKINNASTVKGTAGSLGENKSYQYYILAKSGGVTINESGIIPAVLASGEMSTTIKWEQTAGAEQYELYRSDSDGSGGQLPFKLLSIIQAKDQNGNPIANSDQFLDNGYIPLKPNPDSMTITENGTLGIGTYYYIVTAVNSLGESHQGYKKKVRVANTGSSVILEWGSITNAYGYKVYRAISFSGEPDVGDFKLIAASGTDGKSFVFKEDANEGYILFTDINLPSGIETPPNINSQGVNAAKVVCISCHYAHGTKKTDSNTGNSHLKRMDNSGVCQNCHKK